MGGAGVCAAEYVLKKSMSPPRPAIQFPGDESYTKVPAAEDVPAVELVPEYGVVHLKHALNEREQQDLWDKCKRECKDPGGATSGMTSFHVSSGAAEHRDHVLTDFGELLFQRSATELAKLSSDEDMKAEPSYMRLWESLTGLNPVVLNHITGNCYRKDSILRNHCDMAQQFFTMSVALGDDIEFTVGKKTTTPNKNERSGTTRTLLMKSGDAIFFDGGSIPHSVDRILPGTAPAWWASAKHPNGSRVAVLFRET